MLNLKPHLKTKEIEPELYVIVVNSRSTESGQTPNTYVHWGVYYSLQEAKNVTQKNMKGGLPPNVRFEDFEWTVTAEVALTSSNIEQLFKNHKSSVAKDEKYSKNDLMMKILATKDLELLENSRTELTKEEIKYLLSKMK